MKPHYYIMNDLGYVETTTWQTLNEALVASRTLASKHNDRTYELLKVVAITRCSQPTTDWTCDNEQAAKVIDDIKKPEQTIYKARDRVRVIDRGTHHGMKGTVVSAWFSPNGYGEFDSVKMDVDRKEYAYKPDELEPLPHEYKVGDKVWIIAGNNRGKVGKITRIITESVNPYDVNINGLVTDFSQHELSPVEPSDENL